MQPDGARGMETGALTTQKGESQGSQAPAPTPTLSGGEKPDF